MQLFLKEVRQSTEARSGGSIYICLMKQNYLY